MSKIVYENIIICGFRATGKSTISRLVAKKIGWGYIEMDEIIEKKAEKTIVELTRNGSEWQEFRQLEQKVLEDVLTQKNVVISAGGGVGVNNILKTGTNETFGEINTKAIQNSEKTLSIVIDDDERSLKERIEKAERRKLGTRPILDEKLAALVKEQLNSMNEEEKRTFMIDKIVEDSMNMYKIRKPLYEKLTPNVIDASNIRLKEVVNKIINLL